MIKNVTVVISKLLKTFWFTMMTMCCTANNYQLYNFNFFESVADIAGTFKCPHNLDLFAHPEDCQQFYDCDEFGRATPLYCPEGFVFNTYKQYCDFPSVSPPCKQGPYRGATGQDIILGKPYQENAGERIQRELDRTILNKEPQISSDMTGQAAGGQYARQSAEYSDVTGTLTHISQAEGREAGDYPGQLYEYGHSDYDGDVRRGIPSTQERNLPISEKSSYDFSGQYPTDIMGTFVQELDKNPTNAQYKLEDMNQYIPLYVPMVANAQAMVHERTQPGRTKEIITVIKVAPYYHDHHLLVGYYT